MAPERNHWLLLTVEKYRGVGCVISKIIYLYRYAEGDGPVRKFLTSYRSHPSGVDHDLNVAFKGFPDETSLVRARALFADIPINSIELDDDGYDVGSYKRAANAVFNRRLLFLNTFSLILCDNWLAHFNRAMDRPGVGLVGATGSWQANSASYEALIVFLLRDLPNLPIRLIQVFKRTTTNNRFFAKVNRFRLYLRYFGAPIGFAVRYYQHGRYPNPHIRTNAFMIERDRFLSLKFPGFATKRDVYMFESGRRHSMTKQILAQGLEPVVVDRTGKVYGISEWRSSLTFWNDEQANLTIADNRTADYSFADKEMRQTLENFAWIYPWEWKFTRR